MLRTSYVRRELFAGRVGLGGLSGAPAQSRSVPAAPSVDDPPGGPNLEIIIRHHVTTAQAPGNATHHATSPLHLSNFAFLTLKNSLQISKMRDPFHSRNIKIILHLCPPTPPSTVAPHRQIPCRTPFPPAKNICDPTPAPTIPLRNHSVESRRTPLPQLPPAKDIRPPLHSPSETTSAPRKQHLRSHHSPPE